MPGAPSNLAATAVSSSQIDLSWTAATGTVTNYRVERSATSGTGFVEVALVVGTTYQSAALTALTQYFYRVRACNTGGCSAYSSEASATTQPAPPAAPGAPSNLAASAVSLSQINLSWAAGTGTIDSYRIERKTGAGAFAEVASVSGATLAHSDMGLAASTPYDYQVRACNTGGCSAYTTPALATTQAAPPAAPGAPSNLAATAVSSSQIDLSWTAATGTVDSYRVERSTTTGTGFVEIALIPGTTHQNTGLTASTQYFYRVRACNTGGCSAYTSEVSATTQAAPPAAPGAPSNLAATAVSSSQIDLSWTAATGTVSNYRVERSTTTGTGFVEIASVAGTTYQSGALTALTQYFYRVRACNVGGCSAYSSEASATTQAPPLPAPGAPSNLTASAVSSSQINLSWAAGTGTIDSYRIERKTGAGAFAEVASVSGATLGHSDMGLTALTLYDYQVRACNTGGCSAYTTPASATTQAAPPAAPGAPSNLAATAVSSSQIDLSWTAATGTVDSYRVERSTTTGTGFVEIASIPGTTYQSTALTASTQYFYRVRACNTGGCSAYTSEVSATTQAPPLPAPGAPSNLTASAVSSSQINLSWAAGTGTIDSYRIERKTGAGAFAEVASVSGATLGHPDMGLTASTLYDYQVRACNTGGCSAYTTPASATTQAAPPAAPGAPSNLAATAVSSSQIDLSWTASTGTVTDYRVERSTTTGTGFVEIASISGTTYQSTALTASTQYFYRVRACNTGGCSAYSNEASATTQAAPPAAPGAPSNLAATPASSSQINLTWAAASGTVDSYKIERKTGGGAFAEIASLAGGTLAHSDMGLAATTPYDYQVRACNAGGCSAYSSMASASTPTAAPSVPGTLTATPASASQINLSWTASTGTVDSYGIRRRSGPGMYSDLTSVSGATLTYSDMGLSASTQYEYQVRACNTGGCSQYGSPASATTLALPAPPAAPTGLTPTVVSSSQIDLSWTASAGTVDSYKVERSTTSGSGFTEIASVSGTTYQSTALTAATQYYYRVRACNAGGCSAYTSEASATTQAAPPAVPSVPGSFTATAGPLLSLRIDLAWAASTGTVVDYKIERKSSLNPTYAEIATVPAGTTTYQDSGFPAVVQYTYRIRACNTGGCSAYSTEASATPN